MEAIYTARYDQYRAMIDAALGAYFTPAGNGADGLRQAMGYSASWMHHKGRNRHHYEYWNDYSATDNPGTIVPVPMPDRYIAEMIMDRIAACKVYEGKKYTDASPYAYYQKGSFRAPMHEETRRKLERMLKLLAKEGEEKTFARIEREMVRRKSKKRVNRQEDKRAQKIDQKREQICKNEGRRREGTDTK